MAKLPNTMTVKSTLSIDFARRARIIKAMGHPSRLLMLHALAEGEMCVCDLRDLVGADLSTVSKHLSLLKKAGLVEDRKEGLRVNYRLRVPCILNFMECVEAVIKGEKDSACCTRT